MSAEPTTHRRPTPSSPHHERHVTIEIKSTSGNLPDQRFSVQERAQAILERAIKRIPLDPNPPSPYKLVLKRTGQPLALTETIAALDIRDGDVVIVQAGQPKDG